jgi:hypothetical protein
MMRPEDDPRYLAPVQDFVPRGETTEALENQIALNGSMLSTFSTEGWRYVRMILEDRRDAHISALTKVSSNAMTMDVIFGLRQGLHIIEELLGLEDLAKERLKHDSELLNKLRNREAQVNDR